MQINRKLNDYLNRGFVCLIILFLPAYICAQSLTLASWNIKDFGQSRDEVEIKAIANHLRNVDIVLIQEVVAKHPGGVQAVARLDNELDRMGADWDYIYSDPTRGFSGHVSERYAIMWKRNKIKLVEKGRLLSNLEAVVHREPFMAIFEFAEHKLRVLNYHSRRFDQHPEVELKVIAQYLNSTNFSGSTILAGDFNMSEDNEAFNWIYNLEYTAAIKNTNTTLKRACKAGVYTNYAIDNIYYSLQSSLTINKSGIMDFVNGCEDFPEVRDSYSDHLPVYVRIKVSQ